MIFDTFIHFQTLLLIGLYAIDMPMVWIHRVQLMTNALYNDPLSSLLVIVLIITLAYHAIKK